MIETRHLFTLTADVPKIIDLGATPNGARRIATVTGGTFKGERLSGTIQPTPGGDWLLALTPDTHLNELACARYRRDFESRNVYALKVRAGTEGRATVARAGRDAFGEEATYAELSRRLFRGAEVRKTRLTGTFGLSEYRERYADRAVPLFALDPKGRLEVFATGARIEPGPDWSVIALVDVGVEPQSPGGEVPVETRAVSA